MNIVGVKNEKEQKQKSFPAWAIALIVVGCVLLISILVFVRIYYRKISRDKYIQIEDNGSELELDELPSSEVVQLLTEEESKKMWEECQGKNDPSWVSSFV